MPDNKGDNEAASSTTPPPPAARDHRQTTRHHPVRTFVESSPMENYTIPIEKAVDLTPVSSQPVRLFSPVVFPCSGTRSFPIQSTDFRPQDTFTNAQPLWSFVGGYGVYGGSTLAHCLVAAQKTIPSDCVAHSLHCSFVAPPIQSNRLSIVLNEHAMGKASSRGPSTPPRRPR